MKIESAKKSKTCRLMAVQKKIVGDCCEQIKRFFLIFNTLNPRGR